MVSVALRVAFKSGADVLNKPEVGAVLPQEVATLGPQEDSRCRGG